MADEFRFRFERPPDNPALAEVSRVADAVVWDFRELVIGFCAVVALFFLFATLIILPITAATSEEAPEALAAQAVTVVVWDASMVFIVIYLVRKTGGNWLSLGFRRPLPKPNGEPRTPRSLLGFVVAAYAASYGLVLLYSLTVGALGLDFLEPSQQLPDAFFDHDWILVLIGISVVFAAPISEEVFFRGFLFAGLRKRMPFVVAAVISGFLFSLAHADPGLILPFTLVGFVLAFAYERTGSLFTSIGVHFVFNALSFLALVFVPDARG